ncbi:MAG: hypothetical protein KGI52_09480, partial [Burkholderiales bacterium]|nr:hypothetical protein [Burkholderiales bacterium]
MVWDVSSDQKVSQSESDVLDDGVGFGDISGGSKGSRLGAAALSLGAAGLLTGGGTYFTGAAEVDIALAITVCAVLWASAR